MSGQRYDLVVVGAGIFGLTSAYHVLRNGSARVLIIDERSGPGQGNTGRSVGGFRSGLFSSELNRVLSESTVAFFRHLQFSGVDLGMEEVGYLILLTEEMKVKYSKIIEDLRGTSKVVEYDVKELQRAIPYARFELEGDEEAKILGLDKIKGAIFSPRSGYLDVEKLVDYYYRELRSMGAEFKFNTRVERLNLRPVKSIGHPREPLAWQAKRIESIETGDGTLRADQFLLAAGSWVNQLTDPLGIESFIRPKKRQVFAVKATGGLSAFFDTEGFNETRSLPMTFIPKGPHIIPRVRERSLWFGFSDDVGRPWGIDDRPEESFYFDNIHPVLSRVFPVLENVRPDSMWAGSYSINAIDQSPIVYRVLNLVTVTGGSGSGLMKSDSVGRVAAAVIMGKETVELFDGRKIDVELLDVRRRRPDPEILVF
ncbi:MAG: FAD-binding oxidoreductase [Aigarchaeota archaeon]|nr:FAD-binding oxidoreductase [Aigarchaeota archaeon]MDW8093170.1 FAD-binding oxidoreductase [Nitrososphaerota archaeon]